jgi:hypothetical protein
MKWVYILLFASLGFNCKKLDKLTEFDLSYNQTVVIPSSTTLNLPLNIPTPDFTTNSESTFSQNNTNSSLIQSIFIDKLDVTINSPTSGNFNFLKSVVIYISTPNLPETKVAWKDPVVNNNSTQLTLDLSTENLIEYLKSDTLKLKLVVVTDELITSDYHIDVTSKFHVKAKLL